jgi:hypothetical protein
LRDALRPLMRNFIGMILLRFSIWCARCALKLMGSDEQSTIARLP